MAVAVAGAGTGAALAESDDGGGTVSGPEAERAARAALEATGGSRVNAVERDSEKGAVWEVEVARADGSTVDVRLGARLGVVAVERDSEQQDDGPDTAG